MQRSSLVIVVIALTEQLALAAGGPYALEQQEWGTRVVRFDASYQTATPVGDEPGFVRAIEYSSDGWLYGVTYENLLVRMDPAVATWETVGPLGIDFPLDEADLDEDANGQLWMLASRGTSLIGLYMVDRTTGATSNGCQPTDEFYGLAILDGRRFTTSFAPNPPDPGCDLEKLDVEREPFSLEVGPDRWIHYVGCAPVSQWSAVCWFRRFDPATGTDEELWQTGPSPSSYVSLTFDPGEQPAGPAIPDLDRRGILAFGLLLACAGLWLAAGRSPSGD